METALNLQEVTKLKQIVAKLADFLALFEVAEEVIAKREKKLAQQMEDSNDLLKDQLSQIYEAIHEFQNIMTEVGVARFRLAASRMAEISEKTCE